MACLVLSRPWPHPVLPCAFISGEVKQHFQDLTPARCSAQVYGTKQAWVEAPDAMSQNKYFLP